MSSPRRVYPKRPLVAVGALIVKGSRILLVKRRYEPSRGLWSVPWGLVEVGERLKEAAEREVMEEVGLKVEADGLVDVLENIVPDDRGRIRFHYIIVDYWAKQVGGRLRLSDEVEAAKWVPLSQLGKSPLTKTLTYLLTKLGYLKPRDEALLN